MAIWYSADSYGPIMAEAGADLCRVDPAQPNLQNAQLDDLILINPQDPSALSLAQAAMTQGLEVVCHAAALDIATLVPLLPLINIIIISAPDATTLQAAFGADLTDLPVETVVIHEAHSARWLARGTPEIQVNSDAPLDPVRLSARLVAALSQGAQIRDAMAFTGAQGRFSAAP